MQRRAFLKGAGAGLGLAASALSPSGFADGPAIKWRLASSYPKSLDTIYGAAELLADRLAKITGGKFQIRVFASGDLVPGLQVMDAVQNGTVECGHTASYYYVGKNLAFAFDCALPFGLTARQQNAWMYFGGGQELMRELFKPHNILPFPGGNTGVQMGGWFRKEIKSLADLKGLKMRIPGIGGQIMAKLGAVPQTLAGTDIYPALERGALDAAEWVGPYDDEKLGFHKIAKNYYYPGWWEGGPQLSFYVNLAKWNELPEAYRAAFETACAEANVNMLAEYDTKNPQALQRLVKQGVKLRAFPKDVMDAARAATYAMYEEEARKNPAFARIYKEWKAFLDQGNQWFKVAEASYANYLFYAK
ncbi:MAG TPA: TRAP transporter substrate-binding protein [Thiobacillaceae bacterium]|nr:TRAP transporter substrate-binding protein [Thiobacillaceae bacterium]HNA81427.1 TRAP transporter substrate-binding protein [Thiobacillaceae bacterium]HNF87698.1 TRAP transporter substrate-binding protein [Thiobacillaceae bacterium]HNH89148.1 TRAP transporter substrate-binding protein [Thiobacillaceae bacterium]HNI06730.1 TRAP transporter substrate-binding protein [Thiobacillaceae bacterium]